MRLVFDHALYKSSICSVNGNFLGLALTQSPSGACDAHRLCPLTDSFKGTVSSAGAGGNALPHLLPTLTSLSDMFTLLCCRFLSR